MPAIVGRVAAEPGVPRPVQGMHVQDGGILAGRLRIGVHLRQRFVSFVPAQVIVDRRGNRRHDWKAAGILERYAQRALPTHAGAQEGDPRRLAQVTLFDERHDVVEDVPFGGETGIELRTDFIGPPASGRERRHDR